MDVDCIKKKKKNVTIDVMIQSMDWIGIVITRLDKKLCLFLYFRCFGWIFIEFKCGIVLGFFFQLEH